MSQKNNKATKRVAVVVSKQQNKQNKTRPNTRKGSAKVRQESIYAPVSIGIPKRTDRRENHFPFNRREFLGIVKGSVGLNVTKYTMNPGDPVTFPWLSLMSRCFESYRFTNISFEYVPRCSTATAGVVALSPDFNPKDPNPGDLTVALQNYGSGNDCSWKPFNIEMKGEVLSKRKSYFNRPLAPNADIDLYDTGNVFLITSGQPDASDIGLLYVKYSGEFFTPEGKNIGDISPTYLSQGNTGNGVTAANPINNNIAQALQTGDFIQSITGDGTGSVIRFARDFHGLLNVRGTGGSNLTVANPFTLTPLSGTVNLNQTEGAFNPNSSGRFVSSPTVGVIENLMTATAGSTMRVSWGDPATLLESMLSFTSCSL